MHLTTKTLLPLLFTLAHGDVHTIEVGNGGLTFSPQTVEASTGDTIVFELYPQHDVIQGDFSSPCRASSNGFYSGPFSGTDNGKKRFVVNVTNSDPIYFYCSVMRHCQSGMVGGINVPDSGDTIGQYAQSAQNVDQAETPSALRGGQLVEEEQLSSLTSGSSAPTSGSSTPTGSAASTTPAGTGGATQSTGLAGVVAPAQLGGFAAFAMGAAAWFV